MEIRNIMISNNPCKDCITYAICRTQILPCLSSYSDDNSTTHTNIATDYITLIDSKCNKIRKYTSINRPEGTSIFDFLHETLLFIFKEYNDK